LGHEPVTVNLYVVGSDPVAVKQLNTVYTGDVSDLRPAVPAEFRRYLRGGFLTRADGDQLEPSTLTRDFVALPHDTVAPAQVHNQGVPAVFFPQDSDHSPWWVWLLLMAGLGALVVYVVAAIRRSR